MAGSMGQDHSRNVPNGISSSFCKHQMGNQQGVKGINTDTDKSEPIAIIGLSLRFPQEAVSPDAFWQFLMEGRSAMTEVPKERYNLEAFYHPDASRVNALNIRGGHFVRGDIGAFDAPFFSITPAEACCIDPQQRALLESTYKALENAGIPMVEVVGSKTSVYVGCFSREYETMIQRDVDLQAKYLATGTGTAMLANRLSWFFDLAGPSIALDTACSSSLNALHLACQSLRTRESNMAIVAGCNLFYNPDLIIPMTNLNFLSPDSKSRSFDFRANGYSRGEGFGVVIIKRLIDALRDGNMIRAIIRSTGSNQDGRTPGITQPSSIAQEALIRDTYEAGGLDLKQTRYFEAHGTGTPLGDPLEASAIGAVFGEHRSSKKPLFVGALKSNIGHLEGASGIAGLIKAVLVIEKGVIPPNIWFERPSAKILVNNWNLKFPTQPTSWPERGLRRASVNSFGFGGSNAHVVLDDAHHYLKEHKLIGNHVTVKEPPSFEPDSTLRNCEQSSGTQDSISSVRPRLLVWSASDAGGLKRLASVYDEYFSCLSTHKTDENHLDCLAYTLCAKRSSLSWKSFTIAKSIVDLQGSLERKLSKPVRSSRLPSLGFVFTGQGALWNGMGKELLVYPQFRASLEEADFYFRTLGCKWRLLDDIEAADGYSAIHDPSHSQPLCTALGVALVDLLRSWQIFPTSVIGHSSGEIAAAYCIGSISKQSACTIAYYRGTLCQAFSERCQIRGAMMSIGLSESKARAFLSDFAPQNGQLHVSIGCVNSPENVTLTGREDQIDALKPLLDQRLIFTRKLKTRVAYHSDDMDEIATEYRNCIQNISPCEKSQEKKSVTMFSTVTGDRVSSDRLSRSDYWAYNLTSPVRFADALIALCSRSSGQHQDYGEHHQKDPSSADHLLEIGPHSALQGPIKDVLKSVGKLKEIGYSSLLVRNVSALESSLHAVGSLHCIGYPVDLMVVNQPAGHGSHRLLIDLPEYPFDHSQTYWLESRISKNFRFREHARHELLGVPVMDYNPLEPKWRHFLRSSESPWTTDHKVNGVELYPASGMLAMAIEAIRQVDNGQRPIKGYRFKEVTFSKAIPISHDPAGTETSFRLRPIKESVAASFTWNEFQLWTYESDIWTEHCKGFIGVEHEESPNEVESFRQVEDDLMLCYKRYTEGKSRCNIPVSSEYLYQKLKACGYGFGPFFQTLNDICCNEQGESTALLRLRDWSTKVTQTTFEKHVIHPTALDGIFHSIFAGLSKGGKESIPTLVPTILGEAYISNAPLNQPELDAVQLFSEAFGELSQINASVVAISVADATPLALVSGLQLKAVAGSTENTIEHSVEPQPCFEIKYCPDIGLLDNQQAFQYCASCSDSPCTSTDTAVEETEFACFLLMRNALKILGENKSHNLKPHLLRYFEWMKRQINRYRLGLLVHGRPEWESFTDDSEYQQRLFQRVADRNPEGRVCVEVGQNLVPLLNGTVDALELLFDRHLVQDYYRWSIETDESFMKSTAYLNALAHKKPDLKILEIGAGTGSATKSIMRVISSFGHSDNRPSRFANYTFTDISPSFFEEAKETFQGHAGRMRFKTLDIASDPVAQGFELEQYDLIIAVNVFHATPDLEATLQNTRKLMKPGAKLIFTEVCNLAASRVAFIFGLLPGWWLGIEKNRLWSPLLTEKEWDGALRRNGFTGTDVIHPDHQNECTHSASTIISTALETSDSVTTLPNTVIVAKRSSAFQQSVASQLQSQLASIGDPHAEVSDLQELSQSLGEAKCYIFLAELDSPFLGRMEANEYVNLKQLVTSAAGLLWVTQGGGKSVQRPEFDLVHGFSRCIRSEFDRLNFVTLALDSQQQRGWMIQRIIEVFNATMVSYDNQIDQNPTEQEYVEIDGLLCIPRIVEASYLNSILNAKRVAPDHHKEKLIQIPPRPLQMSVETLGLLDSIQFVSDAHFKRPLYSDEVEIEVKATGVNFKDVMVALGQVASDHIGLECAGVVTRVGAKAGLKAGDRVCCIAEGTYKNYVRSKAATVAKLPENHSYVSAAALPLAYCTAYYALYELGHIQDREGASVLIHCGAGGVGQAAIQLAQLVHAEIFVTVGTEEKKRLMMDEYHIPEDHIFSSRGLSFAKRIKAKSQRGVDVVLNSIAGESLRRSWECLAPFGCFVEIGVRDINSQRALPMLPFSKNITFSSVNLSLMLRSYPNKLGVILRKVMALAADQSITSNVSHVYSYAEVEKAFRLLQTGRNMGKIVVELKENDFVPTVPSCHIAYHFDKNATYIVAGGLGGLGRSIARWMVGRGAQCLVLLSRAGARTEPARALLRELKEKGVIVSAPVCDVSCWQSLDVVLAECQQTMPPIKGCIQGAMALKDAIYENMTLEDYNFALKPKVQGSWNLHSALPKGMDFFILLSSINGILGTRSQANYGSGNTYQDALAKYRVSRGEKAVSLDLAMIISVGFVAERPEIAASLNLSGYSGIEERVLHAILDYYCDPALPILSPSRSQILVGLETPTALASRGIDEPHWLRHPIYNHLIQMDDSTSKGLSTGSSQLEFSALLASAPSIPAAGNIIRDALVQKLSRILSVPLDDVDVDQPMHRYGLDSLVAVELRNWLSRDIGADTTVFEILGNASIAAFSASAAAKSRFIGSTRG